MAEVDELEAISNPNGDSKMTPAQLGYQAKVVWENIKNDGLPKTVADQLERAGTKFAVNAGHQLYYYDKDQGVYEPADNYLLGGHMRKWLERVGATKAWSSFQVVETSKWIGYHAPDLWEVPDPDTLNVRNGLLDIDTGELRAHDPDFLSTVQLGTEFDPAAECPAWDRFIGEVFPEDVRDAGVPWEIIASCLTGDISDRKAVLLLGEGKNGKSTFLRAATALLSRDNVVAISFQDLERRFGVAGLYGVLANICPDLPSTKTESSSIFKTITGDDSQLRAENKFQDPFFFKPYCRLIYSANDPPVSADAAQAFFDRWLVIQFFNQFEEDDAKGRALDAALAAELPGALNKTLAALRAMRKRGPGKRFTITQSMREAHAEFQEVTDPVTVWAREHLYVSATNINGEVVWTPAAAIIEALNEHRRREQRRPVTATSFGLKMRVLFPTLKPEKRTVTVRGEKKETRCWQLTLTSGESSF